MKTLWTWQSKKNITLLINAFYRQLVHGDDDDDDGVGRLQDSVDVRSAWLQERVQSVLCRTMATSGGRATRESASEVPDNAT